MRRFSFLRKVAALGKTGAEGSGKPIMVATPEQHKTGRIQLHTWRDFTKIMKILSAGKWIYRGQEDASWRLKSGLDRYLEKFDKAGQRGKDGSRNSLFLSTFPRAEYFAISRFQAMSREYQEWDSDVDALIAMQHYGAKTRLLDFTTSIMIALFFAYETKENGKERAIYAINYRALLEQNGMWSAYKKFLQENARWVDRGDEQARWEFDSQIENQYFRDFAFNEAKKLIAMNTQEGEINVLPLYTVCSNKRQMAQTGVELMPRTFDWFDKNLAAALNIDDVSEVNNPSNIVSKDISHLTNAERHIPTALVKLVFDPSMEADAWQFLDQANINAATIYPDLVGVAKSIRYSNSTMMIDKAIGCANESLKATDRWIPIEVVAKAALSDSVSSVSNAMLAKGYSHVPILDEMGRVFGVFSESTMLEAWADGVTCAHDATLRDIKEFLPIGRHKADVFRFVPANTTVAQLRKLHNDALNGNERIGLVLITQNGKYDEPLQGILNVWDIPVDEDTSTAKR